MSIIQIGVIGIAGAVFAIQLKQHKAEFSIYLCIGISILIFFSILNHLEMIISTIKEVAGFINMDMTYISTLLKMLGVTYIAEFSSGICKDAGYGAISEQIEVLGKLSVMFSGLPILLAVVEQIQSYMG